MIYLIISKPLFFFGLAINLTLAFSGRLRFISAMFGGYFWGPITELSLGAYLLHMFWVVTFFGSMEQTLYITFSDLVVYSIAILIVSFISTLPFAYLWVFPMKNLYQLIQFTRRK